MKKEKETYFCPSSVRSSSVRRPYARPSVRLSSSSSSSSSSSVVVCPSLRRPSVQTFPAMLLGWIGCRIKMESPCKTRTVVLKNVCIRYHLRNAKCCLVLSQQGHQDVTIGYFLLNKINILHNMFYIFGCQSVLLLQKLVHCSLSVLRLRPASTVGSLKKKHAAFLVQIMRLITGPLCLQRHSLRIVWALLH